MSPDEEITHILTNDGATLLRQKKHHIYRLSNGKNFVRSSTPCKSGDLNDLHNLKRLLGLNKAVYSDGERREKKVVVKASSSSKLPSFTKSPFNGTLAAQLQSSGVTDAAYKEQITALEIRVSQLEYALEVGEEETASVLDELLECDALILAMSLRECGCWLCRVRRWWK